MKGAGRGTGWQPVPGAAGNQSEQDVKDGQATADETHP